MLNLGVGGDKWWQWPWRSKIQEELVGGERKRIGCLIVVVWVFHSGERGKKVQVVSRRIVLRVIVKGEIRKEKGRKLDIRF